VNKTRARDLLRKHYGLGVGHPPPLTKSESAGKSNANDPMDLGGFTIKFVLKYIDTHVPDSAAFDAKTYYDQLITTSSLPALLKRENELLTGMSVFNSISLIP
jgi:hypothetical protein